MKRLFALAAVACLFQTATQASVLAYAVDGTFSDGAKLSGHFSFDDHGHIFSQFSHAAVTVSGMATLTEIAQVNYPGPINGISSYSLGFYDGTHVLLVQLGFEALHEDGDLRAIMGTALSPDETVYLKNDAYVSLSSGTIGRFIPPAPEPATWAMFIGGFGFIGGAMRRRRDIVVSFG